MYAIRSYYVVFHPDSIRESDYIPNVVLTELKINNTIINTAKYPQIKKSLFTAEEIVITSYSIHYTKLYDENICIEVIRYRAGYARKSFILDKLALDWNDSCSLAKAIWLFRFV